MGRRLRGAAAGAGVGILCLCGGGGCVDPLFPEDQARSPFERYSSLRGNEVPKEDLDAFGRPRSALRARLAPLETR